MSKTRSMSILPMSHADSRELGVELTGAPSGVARQHARTRGGRGRERPPQQDWGGREIQPFTDGAKLRLLWRVGQQDPSTFGLDGTAEAERQRVAVGDCRLELDHRACRQIGRAIQHEAEGAVGRVVAQEHDRSREIRILQLRHRYEQGRLKRLEHRHSPAKFSNGPGHVVGNKRIVASGRIVRLEQRRHPRTRRCCRQPRQGSCRSRLTPARFIALPFNSARSSSSVCCHSPSSDGASRPARGTHALSEETPVEGVRFHGQTSWQMSQPYACRPMSSRALSGIAPLSSMVRYERQRVASMTCGSTSAPVGHASRQRAARPALVERRRVGLEKEVGDDDR